MERFNSQLVYTHEELRELLRMLTALRQMLYALTTTDLRSHII